VTLNRVTAQYMSRTLSFEEATDSFAGWFCEWVGQESIKYKLESE
jgi:hypothetical protein